MSSFFPLNANDDGRATTWSWGSFESALMSSSLMPSLRYSSCGAPLTFTNGSTAIDWPVPPAKAGVPCDRDSTRSPAAAASRVAASPAPAARRDVRRPVSRTRCAGAARATTNPAAVAERSAGGLGERPHDRFLNRRRDRRAHRADPRRRRGEMLAHDALRARPRKGRLARQHLVQHAPETVDVAPLVHPGTRRALLGAHVARRPERDPR